MAQEIAPRTYDERIAFSDAERRAGREIKRGAILTAVVERVQSQRSYGVRPELLTERDFYSVVQTALVQNGKVLAVYRYTSDGRVKSIRHGAYHLAPTDAFSPCRPESEKPPTRGRQTPAVDPSTLGPDSCECGHPRSEHSRDRGVCSVCYGHSQHGILSYCGRFKRARKNRGGGARGKPVQRSQKIW